MSAVGAPPPVPPERRAAGRERALAQRRMRAAVKADVRAGRVSGADVIRLAVGGDEYGRAIGRMSIGELLLSIPGVGPATAERALLGAGISGRRRLVQLGPRQIERLGPLL